VWPIDSGAFYEKLEGVNMTEHHADILVIDDELTVCRSCQKVLHEDGYDVNIVLN
jgi:hypothetical protein